MSYGIGMTAAAMPGLDGLPSFLQPARLFQAGAGALVGCAGSAISGGKCSAGASAAGVTAFVGQFLPTGNNVLALVANSTLGGLASVAGGGKFANGAVLGAFAYLFGPQALGSQQNSDVRYVMAYGMDPDNLFNPDSGAGIQHSIQNCLPCAVVEGAIGLAVSFGPPLGGLLASFGAPSVVTIADAVATLPAGMTRAEFGALAGFGRSLAASSSASTVASAETVANLKAAGVTAESIATWQQFYAGAVLDNPANLSAVHRAALLLNILKAY